MIHIPIPESAPIAFVDNTRLIFPNSYCCNCGRTDDVAVIPQKTALIRGIEWKTQFMLPFCLECTASSKRRPLGWLHRTIVLGGCFLAFWITALLTGFYTENEWIERNTASAAFVPALILVTIYYSFKRPRKPQTSYFQPVQISSMKQEFLSGRVSKMWIYFSNPFYAEDFHQFNESAINAGRIVVTCPRKDGLENKLPWQEKL